MAGGIEAAIFDLDGTLVDTMDCAPTAYVDTIRALGGPVLAVADVVAVWHMGPTPVVLEHFLRRSVAPDDLARFSATFADAMKDVHAFPGVVSMLEALVGQGCQLAVVTTATTWAADLMLANAGLDNWFMEKVVGGDDVSDAKPSPEGLLQACQRMTIDPQCAAYIGDSSVDMDCAHRAGALAVHASWGAGPVPGGHLVAHAPHHVVRLLRPRRAPRAQTS